MTDDYMNAESAGKGLDTRHEPKYDDGDGKAYRGSDYSLPKRFFRALFPGLVISLAIKIIIR